MNGLLKISAYVAVVGNHNVNIKFTGGFISIGAYQPVSPSAVLNPLALTRP